MRNAPGLGGRCAGDEVLFVLLQSSPTLLTQLLLPLGGGVFQLRHCSPCNLGNLT